MLDNKGFDLWSNAYDKEVGISDEDKTYPFAGYKKVLNAIYSGILESSVQNVLDIGFGTGILANKLYEKGYHIYGQDFSDEMLKIAQNKMPKASLWKGDFSKRFGRTLNETKV